jgi:hypothetical protein
MVQPPCPLSDTIGVTRMPVPYAMMRRGSAQHQSRQWSLATSVHQLLELFQIFVKPSIDHFPRLGL